MRNKKANVIVVIPAFNEEGRVGRVIQGIPRDAVDEVLVIDDHSTDSTARESLRSGAVVVSQTGHARGVGAAIKLGYGEGLRRGGEILVVLAGDTQHDPTEIPKLLAVIRDGQADYVAGDRLSNSPVAQGMPPPRYVGNVLLTLLTRLTTGIDVKDSQCGFTAISRAALEKVDMKWLSDSWGITNGLLAECKRNHLRVKSVPVSTHYGARRSYIHLGEYVPRMIFILTQSFYRVITKG